MARPRMSAEERATRFWSRVTRTEGGCWEWTGAKNGPGYGKVYDGERVEMAHRYAYLLAVGAIPPGMFICHRCDNPACVRPEHLFLGTQSDNSRDAYQKGRLEINRRNATGVGIARKLDADKVRDIRYRARAGESQQSIADAFKVNQTLISAIVTGKTWKHVA